MKHLSVKLKHRPDAEHLAGYKSFFVTVTAASGFVSTPHPLTQPSPSRQSVVCGHGTRYRNLTCLVSDGSGGSSGSGESSAADEELCSGLELAVDGDKQIVLSEACTLPCPGNQAAATPRSPSAQHLFCMSGRTKSLPSCFVYTESGWKSQTMSPVD